MASTGVKTAIRRLAAHKLALLLALTVIVRLVVLLALPDVFAFEVTGAIHGSEAYDTYARNLLSTGVYGRVPGEADAFIPPLYSYALAGVYALLGRGALPVGLIHILLDVLSIALLVGIARRLMPQGEWVGWLAGLFYALYPYLVFQNLTLIDTPLFMALLHGFIYLMVLLRQRPALDRGTWLLAVVGGVILGMAMLTRPIVPPLALLVTLWFLFRQNVRQTVLRLLPVAIVSVLVLVPWIVRNYGIYEAFVPMTTTSGANFWQGNSPYTIPYFRAGYDVQWTSPDDLEAADVNSREADAERFTLALAYLRENPEVIPELIWVKFQVYWSIDIAPRYNPTAGQLPRLDYEGNPIIATDDEGGLELGGLPQGDPVDVYSSPLFDQLGRLVHRYYYGLLFFLALLGVGLTLRQWRETSLLWFVQLSMTLVYIIFHPSTRYRVPTDPLLFVFSAYAVVRLAGWVYGRLGIGDQPDKTPQPGG